MLHIDQLLDQLKERHSIGSDYKLAAYLGVVPGAVKHWRHGRSLPDASTAALIADELQMDAELLVAELEMHRAQNEKSRAIWERMAARLQAGTFHSAIFALLVVMGFITTPPNAHAVVTDVSTTGQSVYYVNKTITLIRGSISRLWGKFKGLIFGNCNVPGARPITPALAFA